MKKHREETKQTQITQREKIYIYIVVDLFIRNCYIFTFEIRGCEGIFTQEASEAERYERTDST
jgi:hypothetical protein